MLPSLPWLKLLTVGHDGKSVYFGVSYTKLQSPVEMACPLPPNSFMSQPMSEAIKNMFSEISPTYDRLNHALSFNLDKRWRKKSIALIKQNINTEFSTLDLCAGTLDLSLECLKQFPKTTIHAVDFSETMLAEGMEKVRRSHQKDTDTSKIIPVCSDALNLPFHDNFFDVIICSYGIRNFDDTNKGVIEMYRILKPGGQIVILDFFKPSSRLSHIFHNTYASLVIPTVGRLLSGHSSAYRYLRDSIQGFLTVEEFEQMLEKNEFNQINKLDFFGSVSTALSAIKNKKS